MRSFFRPIHVSCSPCACIHVRVLLMSLLWFVWCYMIISSLFAHLSFCISLNSLVLLLSLFLWQFHHGKSVSQLLQQQLGWGIVVEGWFLPFLSFFPFFFLFFFFLFFFSFFGYFVVVLYICVSMSFYFFYCLLGCLQSNWLSNISNSDLQGWSSKAIANSWPCVYFSCILGFLFFSLSFFGGFFLPIALITIMIDWALKNNHS